MGWYSNNQLLSYNSLFNFVLSPRGNGKTFDSKKWMIKDFLKNGNEFMYVRRFKSEFEDKDLFFEDVKPYFPKIKFEVKGMKAYINDKVAGYFMPLSISLKKKSTAYPRVNKIIYDEFIIQKANNYYLKNEVTMFLDLFETVARKRDNVRALFLANNVSYVNPYFTYFNMRIRESKRFTRYKDGLITVELFTDDEFIAEKEQTRFGRLVSGTIYGDYSIHNKSLENNNNFILRKKPKNSKFLCSFKLDNREIGCWISQDEGILHFNKHIDTFSLNRFSMTKNDHAPNFILINIIKKRGDIKEIKRLYGLGLVRYESQEVKELGLTILKML